MTTAPLTADARVVRTLPLDPDQVGPLLARLPRATAAAWVTGDDEGFVAWGEAARLEVTGPERFSRAQRWWSSWVEDADVEDPLGLPGSGPMAFCSFAFDPASDVPSVVIVPAVVLARRGGQAWLTVVGETRASVGSLASEALTAAVAAPESPRDVRYAEGSLTAPEWELLVEEAVRRIGAGELDKVVLARDISVTCARDIDVRHVLTQLAAAYPSCWTYVVDGLVGATPELLVRRMGADVTSRVLAGTVRRSGDSGRDESLATGLLASAKERAEHGYAVRSVAAALAAHCTDLSVPGAPSLLRLANVQHLATDVTGSLADSSSVLALAASLHPTAAVCGTPTERALAVIRELERMERGRYAGPVGWVDARGDGELGIALRCGLVAGASVRLYAGCGLVAGSESGAELAESQAKLSAMRDALEP